MRSVTSVGVALQIEFTKQAEKEISKAPILVREKIELWLRSIRFIGLEATRQWGGKGLHDEPLKGQREGQRSIRLGKSWRLIYTIERGELVILRILTVNKHDYR